MTQPDLDREKLYRIQERLALSCGASKPTKAEMDRAEREVAEDFRRLELNEVIESWNV